MEERKNSEIISILFKMQNIQKAILNSIKHLKGIKPIKDSIEIYNSCFNTLHEASIYFFQATGFLKAEYINGCLSYTGKNFLLNKLFIPAFRNFQRLQNNLKSIEVDDIYSESLKLLQNKVEYINCSLFSVLSDINNLK
ncbi:hypothetical protein SAMN05660865_01438 [Caloramator fervidus]|uniref:Uncharacterized protein n=1 Tax=Caloramator fervidus TaxID=29344 RepID=A0A1H5WBP0_9CLOT|nr:hypothetical protein [Caloramator fervidus]SEF96884.1 hypothetical protein SAMN05660865_01438 [Caloramator fervidus]